MKNSHRSAALIVSGVLASSPVAAPAAQDADGARARRLDQAIERALAERRIVGTVVLVARDGKLIYHRAAGLADREHARPTREDDIFLYASVTKAFVSVAALRLVEQGRLRLDESVGRWLPEFRPKLADGRDATITIRQLMTHTAGLSYSVMEGPDGAYRRLRVSSGLDQPGLSWDENFSRLRQAPLAYPPGSSWGYSMASDVLGAVIGKAYSKDLRSAVRELVTEPLGARDAAFEVVDRSRLVAHYADGKPEPIRIRDGQDVPFNGVTVRFDPSRIFDAASYPSGGGGMAGTARDVLELLETLRTGGGGLLKGETLREAMRDQVGAHAQTQGPGWGFGLGWAVLVDPQLAKTPQSKGTIQWGGAYGHSWFVDPAAGLSVVALTNTTFEGMAGQFVTDVRDAVYGW